MYDVLQCTMYIVQCTMYIEQCTMCIVQCTLYSVQLYGGLPYPVLPILCYVFVFYGIGSCIRLHYEKKILQYEKEKKSTLCMGHKKRWV